MILRVGATATVALGLLYPLVELATRGLSVTGMTEESTGYRYFYSLRMLYAGQEERPWLPQGQLVGLAHMGIQLVLTAVGYPISQLSPRIDVFAALAAALPLVLAAALFAWATRTVGSAFLVLLAATALLTVAYQDRVGYGYQLVEPDYMAWAIPVALLMCGWLLRLGQRSSARRLRIWDCVLPGVFAGACLAIKPTYLAFAVPVLLMTAFRSGSTVRRLVLLIWAGLVAPFTWVGLTWAYFLGSQTATTRYFERLQAFVAGVDNPDPFGVWLRSAVEFPPDVTTLGILLPVALVVSIGILPNRPISLCLLPSAAAFTYVAYKRFYPVTLAETTQFAFSALLVWGVLVIAPLLKRTCGARRPALPTGVVAPLGAIALVVCFLWVRTRVERFNVTTLGSFETATAAAASIDAFIGQTPGQTVFLVPNNSYRPTTVDSAIFKGGSNLETNEWGDSPFVRAMFPDRSYIWGHVPASQSPLDLQRFRKIVFVSIPSFGGEPVARQALKDTFGVTTDGFTCQPIADLSYHLIFGCTQMSDT